MARPMRWYSLLLLSLCTGCVSSSAYRAHFQERSEIADVRACAASCELAGDDVAACLDACPGLSKTPGRCNAATEAPGTYCVTVETRIYPDFEFWAGVAKAAGEDDDDDDDDDATESASSSSSSAPSRHAASPVARPAPTRRSQPRRRDR